MTRSGKWFLLLTVGAGIAAVNTGNNLLYLALSMNLSLVVLSGVLSEWCLRRVSVRVRHASEAFCRRESFLAVTCRSGAKRFPSLGLSVALTLPGGVRRVRLPDVPAGRSATRIVPFVPDRRGPIPSVPCAVSTLFPFGLFEKFVDLLPPDSLLVYPEPAESADPPSGDRTPDPAASSLSAGRRGSQIRGVREHLPTDPVRDIHWKASARLGRWMVKERDGESAPVRDLVLDLAGPEDEIERRLSRACGLILRWDREGHPYRLRAGSRLCVDVGDADRRSKALSVLALATSRSGNTLRDPAADSSRAASWRSLTGPGAGLCGARPRPRSRASAAGRLVDHICAIYSRIGSKREGTRP